MKYLLICTMTLLLSGVTLVKHHHKEPPCNHETLDEAWSETQT